MRRLLLPAIALGFSMLPLASGASANVMGSATALAGPAEQAAATEVNWRYGYRHPRWRGYRYGFHRGPSWHRYGHWRGSRGRYGHWRG